MFICVVWANSVSEGTNEIDHEKLIRFNPALRRALLRALEDLENESEDFEEENSTDTSLADKDEILEDGDEASPKKRKEFSVDQIPAVQYHSFVVDGQKAFKVKNSKDYEIEKKKLEAKKVLDPLDNEDIEVKETSNLNSITQTRSIQSNIAAENFISKDSGKESSKKPAITTTTTTTTTTPKPSHNEDGENIEELENHEVQVYQAPLVAAFTVHQDALGLPKKVVPIFKEAVRRPILPTLPVTTMQLNPIKTQSNNIEQSIVQQQVPTVQTSNFQQLTLQQQLESKQRFLEEQLQKLQLQQRQHEAILHQQQLIQQQQLQQRQQQERFLEEQNFRQAQINNLRQQPKNVFQTSSVSFLPSITLDSPPSLEQALPQKEAVDFLVHLRSGQRIPFPLQQTAPIIPNVNLQVPHEKQYQNFVDKNQNSGTVRVFRQDSATGNFGLNTNDIFSRNNRFNANFNKRFPVFPNQNRFKHNDELKSLLYQSGLTHGGRSQEDLSIISKVLSLNHGLPPNFVFDTRNLHFDESRRLETKIQPNGNS